MASNIRVILYTKGMSFIKKVFINELRHVLWLIVAILLTIYVVLGRDYSVLVVHGESMEPTYEDKSFLITEKINPKKWHPSRYDIVIIKDSEDGDRLAKRIIGLQGETVEHKDGYFYVDGEKLRSDTYGRQTHDYTLRKGGNRIHLFIKKFTIPKGCVFVIGDNRGESMYGTYLIEEVKSEVIINI